MYYGIIDFLFLTGIFNNIKEILNIFNIKLIYI